MALLEVSDLWVSYGMIAALRSVSFKLEEGQVVTLIGANGAGKSTTLKAISGLLKPVGGSIRFEDRDITGAKPVALALDVELDLSAEHRRDLLLRMLMLWEDRSRLVNVANERLLGGLDHLTGNARIDILGSDLGPVQSRYLMSHLCPYVSTAVGAGRWAR